MIPSASEVSPIGAQPFACNPAVSTLKIVPATSAALSVTPARQVTSFGTP